MKTTIKIGIIAMMAAAGMQAEAQVYPSYAQELTKYTAPYNKPKAPPSFTYAPDGNGYLLLSSDGRTVDRYDIATGEKIETVFDVATARETRLRSIEGFEMSENGRYMVVYANSEPVYRRSYTAEHYVYEVRTRLLKPLSTEHPRQQAPLISPDGRMVAFVSDNNIYIRKNDYGSEVAVTRDGKKNELIYGVPDWVCEEEFASNISMTWSPDNLMLCFISYDESQVPMYTLPIYGGACDTKEEYVLYPGTYSYKYPVAGANNSKVKVHSYDVETRKVIDLPLPDPRIEYVPRIAFGQDASQLLVSTLNRDQNHFEIYSVNPRSTTTRSVYTEDSKAWIIPETYEDICYQADGFIVMSMRSGYCQLYKYSYAGALERTITSGNCDVTACYGIDSKGNCYYQVAAPTPMDRTICRVDKKGTVTTISAASGTTTASFAPSMELAMMRYSTATTPPVYTINRADGKQVRVLEDNAAYSSAVASLPKKEFFTMESDGQVLNGYVIKPAGVTGKCPVIMSQYSGPGSQQVLNEWKLDWEAYFATQGYAVVCVDGRGTGGRGSDFLYKVYRCLGKYETIDQVNAARWAAQQPWADGQKIGIYGWSFGGYESLMAASAYNAPYKAAVSIAPVTDWRFYDSIYTERYMLTPQQNEAGYDGSSAVARADKLSCPMLLMYGTSDDNVHPANALEYVSALQTAGGLCDMFIFPNMNHSIYGCNSRAMVYAKMLQFFDSHLK